MQAKDCAVSPAPEACRKFAGDEARDEHHPMLRGKNGARPKVALEVE